MNNIIEAICDPLIIVTPDWKIKKINGGLLDLLGYKKPDLVGKPLDIIFPDRKAIETFKTTGQRLLNENTSVGNYEEKLVRKNGDIVIVLASCSILRNNDGSNDIIIISKDVSEYKVVEEQFLTAIASADSANIAKSQFLANMSHEIRTPMNAIIGFATLLTETNLDERQTDYVDTINSSSHSLLQIINDILDISKEEAGKLTLESIDFNLFTIVDDTLKTVRATALHQPINFNFDIETYIPHTLEGDPTRLRQTLINLLSNAVKFTKKGEISLTVEIEKELAELIYLKFTVKDSGVGISEEEKRDIFKPFTQADMSTTRKYGGTGLGLSISKSIVEKMGGKIWVDSELGKGSSFIFTALLKKKHQ